MTIKGKESVEGRGKRGKARCKSVDCREGEGRIPHGLLGLPALPA